MGPEHAFYRDRGRIEFAYATDDEALAAFQLCAKLEGIIPALEPSHALAYASKIAPTMHKDKILLVNLSGRGDKDVDQAGAACQKKQEKTEKMSEAATFDRRGHGR